MNASYQICTRCVMDTTDTLIKFDENGVCSRCRTYDENVSKYVFMGDEGRKKLTKIVNAIKEEGKNREYDCIIGVSGGVDSSYAAYLAAKEGLRPLAVSLDNGWDTELAVKNVQLLLDKLGFDLDKVVLDWEEFKDIQLAFLKASTPDCEIPTDHAIIATLVNKAKERGLRNIIIGRNVRTESHGTPAWSNGHQDWRYIKSVHDRFGLKPLRTFPHYTLYDRHFILRNYNFIPILDYVDYRKKDAISILEDEVGWRYYGGKHYESVYTRFLQGYILPKKFGFDKRRSHLSSLICSGEITRDEALRELENEPYSRDMMEADRDHVIKKLGLSEEEFEGIMSLPPKSFWDYPSYERMLKNKPYTGLLRWVYRNFVK